MKVTRSKTRIPKDDLYFVQFTSKVPGQTTAVAFTFEVPYSSAEVPIEMMYADVAAKAAIELAALIGVPAVADGKFSLSTVCELVCELGGKECRIEMGTQLKKS